MAAQYARIANGLETEIATAGETLRYDSFDEFGHAAGATSYK